MISTDYQARVNEYLSSIGAVVEIELHKPQQCPDRCEPYKYSIGRNRAVMIDHNHGYEWIVTVVRGSRKVCLGSWWNSIASRYTENKQNWGNLVLEKKAVKPSAYDVLSSFMCSAYTNQMTFQQWASDFGYDTDSKKAEKIYLACLEEAIKLQSIFTSEELEHLAEIAS